MAKAQKKKPVVGPVTIWIGVFPESTSATTAFTAAQNILALLKDYQINDVDVDFRESYYTREAGSQLLKPVWETHTLADVISPLTPALGLHISTKARPGVEGTMALYLAQGGGSDKLLGLSCRHVLIGAKEANVDLVCHPEGPRKEVLLLGERAFTNLVDSIELKIEDYDFTTENLRNRIAAFEEKEKEKGANAVNTEKAKVSRAETQRRLGKAEKATEALAAFLDQAKKDWRRLDKRVLGHIIRSPAIQLGVGEERFTEDWGIFQIDRAKLGDGFQGNKIDLGIY